MMETDSTTYRFLEGGGEMGALMRSYGWSRSPLGPPVQWPQSLRTIVDVILHSQVPMLLWWGDELIQFYNDAYRPSLGENGKHPRALGQTAKECWPESWHIITPLIDRVRNGGRVWSEDRQIPICRNGKIEDGYWTFGYSPVRDESGSIAGVLVICNETTKQVHALQKIAESERTMRAIVLHAPVAICIVDGDPLRAEVVNDIFLELLGKTREELEFNPFWNVFPAQKELYAPSIEFVARTGRPLHGKEQKVVLLRNGNPKTVFVDYVVEPLRMFKNELGRKVMILAIDVTDKVLARQAVDESQQRYKMLITESTVAIALYYGPELRIQYVNEMMTGYWGKDMSVIGKTLEEAVPELKGQSFLEQLSQVFITKESYIGIEEEAMLKVGGKLQPLYFNYIYKPLKDSEGRIYGIHHMATDVTEQVLARKRVEQSEAIFRNLVLKAPVAIAILKGANFVVEIANERMFSLWGRKAPELINKPIFEGLPEVTRQQFEQILKKVYNSGESYTAEAVPISLPRNGGIEKVYVTFLYEAYRESQREVTGVIVVATDVTEQIKARQRVEELVDERTTELAESNKNLKRSNDALAQFAYIASHDLQEPARKISMFIEMLKTNLQKADQRSQVLLEKIEHSSARMLSLVRDILSYSQLPKEEQQMKKIDLNEILKSVEEDFELLIEEKNATIAADKLPVIEGVPVQINQLFGNLISNALKFTSKERAPRISITTTILTGEQARSYQELNKDRLYHRITFEDNGIGFNPKKAHQIFEIFQRLHGRSEYAGTGIGLAMCKKIVQNHNGDIVAESLEGKGARFHVYLPVSA